MRSALLAILAFTTVGCGGGGGTGGLGSNDLGTGSAPPLTIASPGGLWIGTDSDANPVTILISEDGSFYIMRGPLILGAGIVTATSIDHLNGTLLLPSEFDSGLATQTDCKLTGNIEQRVSLTMDVRCRDSQVAGNLTTLSLTYDARYDRDSSLAAVAGNFNHFRNGSVLNIAGDGTVFSQDGGTSCVTNGRVNVISSAYNVYQIILQFTDCPGLNSAAGGESFSGLALLDDTMSPERLIFGVSNTNSDQYVSILSWADRL